MMKELNSIQTFECLMKCYIDTVTDPTTGVLIVDAEEGLWVNIIQIDKPLNDQGIDYKSAGFTLEELLKQFPDNFVIKKEDKVTYVKLITDKLPIISIEVNTADGDKIISSDELASLIFINGEKCDDADYYALITKKDNKPYFAKEYAEGVIVRAVEETVNEDGQKVTTLTKSYNNISNEPKDNWLACKIIKEPKRCIVEPIGKVIKTNFKSEPLLSSNKVNFTYKPENKNNRIGLFDWAYMRDFNKVINNLKEMALDERWHYKQQPTKQQHPILHKYLHHTFYKLYIEGKVIEEENYASFNTGLVNKLYEPIYAFFEKHKQTDKQKWYFKGFCISGSGALGKELTRHFSPLPSRVQFFNTADELIYDVNALEPQMDWEHIILDNIDRLPVEFLKENTVKNIAFEDIDKMTDDKKIQHLKSLIKNNVNVFRDIKHKFEASLSLALKRVQWNYKTAIPMYYPTDDKMSLLLPLSLSCDDTIHLALVVEKTESGNYLGHTILPLDWAYNNARLIARPDSDWLTAEKITSDE